MRAGGRHCFILAKDKNKKDHKKLRRKLVDHCLKQCEKGRSQAANLETQKQTKWMEMHQSQDVKMIDGTERPKIPSKFAKRAARYNEFGYN